MHRSRFSLASLLLLTAVVAIYFAAIATARIGLAKIDPALVMIFAGAGLGVGAVVGSVAGWRQTGKITGILVGACAGIGAGVASGILMAMPGTFWTIAVGSLMLLLFAGAVRFFSPKAESLDERDCSY